MEDERGDGVEEEAGGDRHGIAAFDFDWEGAHWRRV